MPQVRNSQVKVPSVSVNTMARESHERWRLTKTRDYSPVNKPWAELTPEARKDISRETASNLSVLANLGVQLEFTDEYTSPAPGEPGWIDPEFPNGK